MVARRIQFRARERAGATSTALTRGLSLEACAVARTRVFVRANSMSQLKFVRAKNTKETQWIEGGFDGA